ncbi:hypothetical protein DPMN_087483 [Dreissena polymorpha]|uniref:Uncharacterized protein n=1 Tax=Dreissena polymorpha TaxID=45954 RepID=A0A9D4KT81_DREPO|nr:hypothetical protein DPMN_087483 [Dreissena polymorpha]
MHVSKVSSQISLCSPCYRIVQYNNVTKPPTTYSSYILFRLQRCLPVLHLIVIGITLGLVLTGHDVFPAVFDSLPLYIYNSDRLKELSWKSRQTYERFVFRPVYGLSFNTGYRGRLKDAFEVIFEDPNGNVLTKDHLERIHHAEERLFNIERYQEHFCLWDINYNCMKPQSIIRLFDGTYSHIDPVFSGLNFLNVCDVMYKASIYNETREFMELFVGKDFIATQ